MWWILPWLLFLGCLAIVAVGYLLWRQRHPELPLDESLVTHDVQHFR